LKKGCGNGSAADADCMLNVKTSNRSADIFFICSAPFD
jgi:hypothetical protein